MSQSPYSGLPASQFWKTAITERHPTEADALYQAKFKITRDWKIATAGSCFAQHITRHLKARGFNVLDAEPAPPGLNSENALRFGFGMYSARFGNIYLVRQLVQLAQEASGDFSPAEVVWERNGRYFDAMRPSIEPAGFSTAEEVIANRRGHLAALQTVFRNSDLFVFTFGLTEGWQHTASGTVYPTAPGTLAGNFDPQKYSFRNFTFEEIRSDFLQFRALVRKQNSHTRFLLTVSPVPLTATASDNHVLVATTHSKSVLRAVAGELAEQHDDINYFPSYEIIASPWSRGFFFAPNLRNVTELGVSTVMDVFFAAHGHPRSTDMTQQPPGAAPQDRAVPQDAVCEEILLDAFAT